MVHWIMKRDNNVNGLTELPTEEMVPDVEYNWL